MKLILIVVSALLALVVADTTTTAAASTITTSAEAQCSKSCDSKDTCCIAKCYHVPCPSVNQASDTNKCVSACPQGTGTPEDTKKYSDCEQSCYNSHFLPANGAAATGTDDSVTTTNAGTTLSGTHASETGATTTESGKHTTETGFTTATGGTKSTNKETTHTGSTTSAHASGTNTKNAAAGIKMGASGASALGLILALFAL
ncbi:hypothetical protein N7478_004043 [Penicillium angulare]|uniref:uncharacterized protein n=1 Tax=Penicillium angulare TaxID=116970 RepID=UPI0025400E7E|nr:uncharacterized protein N7478_004043 [Penicillium angulare]KAJ5278671.1 hypothetical protein N7478_004043 [Penicillium angulare]